MKHTKKLTNNQEFYAPFENNKKNYLPHIADMHDSTVQDPN